MGSGLEIGQNRQSRQTFSLVARRAKCVFAWRASNVNDPIREASVTVSAMRTPSATTLLEVSHLCKSFGRHRCGRRLELPGRGGGAFSGGRGERRRQETTMMIPGGHSTRGFPARGVDCRRSRPGRSNGADDAGCRASGSGDLYGPHGSARTSTSFGQIYDVGGRQSSNGASNGCWVRSASSRMPTSSCGRFPEE